MAFPTNAQQETNRKILEDLQIKKQLLQKSITAGVVQGSTTVVSTSEFQPASITASTSRTGGTSSSTTAFGSFIPQDSYYGNSFIPVLPRLEPPLPPSTLPSTSAAAVAAAAAAAAASSIGPSTSAAAAAVAAAIAVAK